MTAPSIDPRRRDAALRPQPRRDGADFWPTPASLIGALITQVLPTLPPGLIWEPAAGDGRLADAMRGADREVIASDLHGGQRIDFLKHDPPEPGRFAAIITNPPFNRLDSFIARGLHLVGTGSTSALVLLVRADALMVAGRVGALNKAAFVLSCNWRARWIADSTGQPRWAYSWITWRSDHQGPPTTLHVRERAA